MSQNKELVKLLDKTISNYNENLGVKELAKAVSHILIENYGEHNYTVFLETVSKELLKTIKDDLKQYKLN